MSRSMIEVDAPGRIYGYEPEPWIVQGMPRFWNQVDQHPTAPPELAAHSLCWLWTGRVADRYPRFQVSGRAMSVWEFAWRTHFYLPTAREFGSEFIAPRAKDTCADLCVRPWHLTLRPQRRIGHMIGVGERLAIGRLATNAFPGVPPHSPEVLANSFRISVADVLDIIHNAPRRVDSPGDDRWR